MAKRFKDLTEREILALAISLEEEDARIFGDFADGLRAEFPATAKIFEEMQAEESEHRASLFDLYQKRFGEHISSDPPRRCFGDSCAAGPFGSRGPWELRRFAGKPS